MAPGSAAIDAAVRPLDRESRTVHRMEAALALAQRLGYRFRLEALGGDGGGGCEIHGQKWLFIDLSLTPQEQLEQVLTALRREAAALARHRAAEQTSRTAQQPSTAGGASPEPVSLSQVAPSTSESRGRILPRWRRWYRMIFGRRGGAA